MDEADARIAGLEAQLRHMHTFDSQHRARIAWLEAERDEWKQCAEVEAQVRRELRAERDAMREMLRQTNHHLATLVNRSDEDEEGEPIPSVREAAKDQVLAVRAALADEVPKAYRDAQREINDNWGDRK